MVRITLLSFWGDRRAIKLWNDPEARRRIDEERQRVFEKREAERRAQRQRSDQEWLDRHKVAYERPGIMPFGKHKDQPLTTVVRDELYYRWFKGTVYARMNPELAADLAAITSTVPTSDCAPVSVEAEMAPGGCVVYRPAIWCRSPEPPEAP